ncbi:MAG: hypothetical protein J7K49_01990 [Thaumarchaeota archaeon]|nr:hypothetical protein [Nitrososphaerota archaeon]
MARKSKRGISAVIGAAIAIAIFFTIIIPTWLYLQSLQAMYTEEVGRRLQYEVERLNEKLEIHATLTAPDGLGRRFLYVMIHNVGPLSANIPTIYVESTYKGLQGITANLVLAPGEMVTRKIESVIVEPGEKVTVRTVTLRGNSFTALETNLGPNDLPYILLVTVTNMSQQYLYRVVVNVLSAGGGLRVGCVSPTSEEFAGGCRERASETIWPIGFTDKQRSVGFMVAPGAYSIKLYRYEWTGTRWGNEVQLESVYMNITDDATVRLDASDSGTLTKIPIRIYTHTPNSVWVLSSHTYEEVLIPFTVSLGNNSVPLRNIRAKIWVTSRNHLRPPIYVVDEVVIERLLPGESYSGYFVLEIKLRSAYDEGQLTYDIWIDSAVREDTGETIDQSQMEQPSLTDLKLTFYIY